MDGLHASSQLRHLLAAAGFCSLSECGEAAHHPRGGLVGPGGFLRAAEDLRTDGAARRGTAQLLRGGPLEPQWLERQREEARRHRFRQRYGGVLPGEDLSAVVRSLAARRGFVETGRGHGVRDGGEPVAGERRGGGPGRGGGGGGV